MKFARWESLTLRTKATIVVCCVMIVGLGTVAAVGLQQTRSTIAANEMRTADAAAGSLARTAELAMAVGDMRELSRLATRSLDDREIVLVAVYDGAAKLLTKASRDPAAWDAYTQGRAERAEILLGERNVELSAESNEFDGEPAAMDTPRTATAASTPRVLGRVVVGLSTRPAKLARQRQAWLMILSTAGATALTLSLVYILLGSWTRRLGLLVTASEKISQGDFTHAMIDTRPDEIGRLGSAYESMRAAVQQRDLELRRFNDTLQQQVADRTKSLEEALRAAQAADQAKSRFLANMSHEIRTTLNGVV
jgi:HAMP domain-containing protein